MKPLVSIIINNYNYGRFLRDAIESALAQTYKNIEVIVVDDGSTDNSREIIKSFITRVIPVLKENGGQASAQNAGFAASSGEVILFLDADDLIYPKAIEEVISRLDPLTSKIHWRMNTMDRDGILTGEISPEYELPSGGPAKTPDEALELTFHSPTSGNAWSRAFLEKVFPLSIWRKSGEESSDFYLSILAPLYGQLKTISTPQGKYRLQGSHSSLSDKDRLMRETQSLDAYFPSILEHYRKFGFGIDREHCEKLFFS